MMLSNLHNLSPKQIIEELNQQDFEDNYALIEFNFDWDEHLVIPGELVEQLNQLLKSAEIFKSDTREYVVPMDRTKSPAIRYCSKEDYIRYKAAKLLGVTAAELSPRKESGPF